jgi:eukaryotic-like serine/threonine-protein kinase
MKHRILRLALAAPLVGTLLAAAPARADWTAYGGTPEHVFVTNERLATPLAVLWKNATNNWVGTQGANKAGPVIERGVIYFPARNQLTAADSVTGEQKWRIPMSPGLDLKDTDTNPIITATPVVRGEMIYVPYSDGTLKAYHTADGTLVWTVKAGGQAIHSSPTLVNDRVFFGSGDGFVRAVDARTGELIWKSNNRLKEVRLPDDVVGAPSYYSGVIYVNTSDMKLWAFQADTGRLLWGQRMMSSSADISPTAFGGKIYMPAGNVMYQFRLRGGNYRSFPMGQWVEQDITTAPVITDRVWYFGDKGGNVYAFSSKNGQPVLNAKGDIWKVKLNGGATGTPILAQNTLFVSTDKGFLYAIDVDKGEVVWSYRTEGSKGIEEAPQLYYPIRAPMVVDAGRLYVIGDDGTLTCFAGRRMTRDRASTRCAPARRRAPSSTAPRL